MKSILTTSLTALAAIAEIGGLAQTASAQDLVFLSTQLRPIEEAQKVRDVILKGAPKTTYVVDEPPPFTVRMKAETESRQAHGQRRRRAARRTAAARPDGRARRRRRCRRQARRPRHPGAA